MQRSDSFSRQRSSEDRKRRSSREATIDALAFNASPDAFASDGSESSLNSSRDTLMGCLSASSLKSIFSANDEPPPRLRCGDLYSAAGSWKCRTIEFLDGEEDAAVQPRFSGSSDWETIGQRSKIAKDLAANNVVGSSHTDGADACDIVATRAARASEAMLRTQNSFRNLKSSLRDLMGFYKSVDIYTFPGCFSQSTCNGELDDMPEKEMLSRNNSVDSLETVAHHAAN
jgi:hypothetical protein